MIDWMNNNRDSVALWVSLLALVVGLLTILISVRQARLETYARMHEALIDLTAARGRKELFMAHKSGTFPGPEDEEWDRLNQALALYDTLGTYYRRRLVPRRLVLASWHNQVAAIRRPAEAFAEHRKSLGVIQPWIGLGYLFDEVEEFRARAAGVKHSTLGGPRSGD